MSVTEDQVMQATPAADGVARSSEHASIKYRNDIDGLRAISVVSVILFHAGLMPNGYLGVDVFFVISGFLITGIIKAEVDRGVFTFSGFYERRIRRILPLALTVTAVSLALGVALMLPDDLENLAQSVVATNLFANNVLQAVTTKDYWDVVNEYKPLLHTWSLGVEEQFYLIWPVALLVAFRFSAKVVLACALALVAASFLLFAAPFPEHVKFYYLPFRFFELAAGGAMALLIAQKRVNLPWAHLAVLALLLVLIAGHALGGLLSTILVVIATCLVMVSKRPDGSLYQMLIENRIALYIGAISFSLYMWHQPVFAFFRYAYWSEVGGGRIALLVGLTMVLSVLSYHFVEEPFRRKRKTSISTVLWFIVPLFAITTSIAFWLHLQSGVVRDVPELDIVRGEAGAGMHSAYNHRVYTMDREFESDRIRILVVGNSFARDWVNVLLESEFSDQIEVTYFYDSADTDEISDRIEAADVVFWSVTNESLFARLEEKAQRIYVVGPKNFGKSAGIFYNYSGDDYYGQRVLPDVATRERNQNFQAMFGEQYVDLVSPISDRHGRVPVFTPDGKFISQDCRHLTRAGAVFYAGVMRDRIAQILVEEEP